MGIKKCNKSHNLTLLVINLKLLLIHILKNLKQILILTIPIFHPILFLIRLQQINIIRVKQLNKKTILNLILLNPTINIPKPQLSITFIKTIFNRF